MGKVGAATQKEGEGTRDAAPEGTGVKEGLSRGLAHRFLASPRTAVLLAAAVYVILLATLSICLHLALKTQMNDLGNVDQALWAAANGDLAMTQSNTLAGVDIPRFVVHANLIFLVLALPYLIHASPVWLLLTGTLSCAAAGLGLYAFARRRLGDTWWTAVPPLAFYASPLTHDANLYDFHVITLYTALLIWALYFFDARRPTAAWSLLALALLCKEDVALIGIMLGGFLFFTDRRRDGIIAVAVCVAYFVVLQGIKGAVAEAPPETAFRWQWLGSNPGEVITTLVTSPGDVLAHLLRPDKVRLPLYLFVCGALAGLRSWPALLLLVPTVGMAMLSSQGWSTRLTGTYYFVFCAAAIILACILSAERTIKGSSKRRPWQLLYLAAATAVLSLLFSPLPHGWFASWSDFAPIESRRLLTEIAGSIPENAELCVQNNLGPHLSQRKHVYSLSRCRPDAEYFLFWLEYTLGPDRGLFVRTSPNFLHEVEVREQTIHRLLATETWGMLYQGSGFYLFGRDIAGTEDRLVTRQRVQSDLTKDAHDRRQADSGRIWWSPAVAGAWAPR